MDLALVLGLKRQVELHSLGSLNHELLQHLLHMHHHFLAVDDFDSSERIVHVHLDVLAVLQHDRLDLPRDHNLGVLALDECEASHEVNVVLGAELHHLLPVVLACPRVRSELLGWVSLDLFLHLARTRGSFHLRHRFLGVVRRVFLVRISLHVLELALLGLSLLDLLHESSPGVGRCTRRGRTILLLEGISLRAVEDFFSISRAHPLVFSHVIHDELEEGRSQRLVRLVPFRIFLLLNLKNFVSIEVNVLEVLAHSLLDLALVDQSPSEDVESVGHSLRVEGELRLLLLHLLDLLRSLLNRSKQELEVLGLGAGLHRLEQVLLNVNRLHKGTSDCFHSFPHFLCIIFDFFNFAQNFSFVVLDNLALVRARGRGSSGSGMAS